MCEKKGDMKNEISNGRGKDMHVNEQKGLHMRENERVLITQYIEILLT